jgi:hypothetical protein
LYLPMFPTEPSGSDCEHPNEAISIPNAMRTAGPLTTPLFQMFILESFLLAFSNSILSARYVFQKKEVSDLRSFHSKNETGRTPPMLFHSLCYPPFIPWNVRVPVEIVFARKVPLTNSVILIRTLGASVFRNNRVAGKSLYLNARTRELSAANLPQPRSNWFASTRRRFDGTTAHRPPSARTSQIT